GLSRRRAQALGPSSSRRHRFGMAPAASRSASALTSRSWAASQRSKAARRSLRSPSLTGKNPARAYAPRTCSVVGTYSLIVLVSFRQVRHHSEGVVLSTVRAVIGGLL